MKAEIFDVLVAAIEAKQSTSIPLIDGRQLKVDCQEAGCRIEIVSDVKMQSAIAAARFRLLYGE